MLEDRSVPTFAADLISYSSSFQQAAEKLEGRKKKGKGKGMSSRGLREKAASYQGIALAMLQVACYHPPLGAAVLI